MISRAAHPPGQIVNRRRRRQCSEDGHRLGIVKNDPRMSQWRLENEFVAFAAEISESRENITGLRAIDRTSRPAAAGRATGAIRAPLRASSPRSVEGNQRGDGTAVSTQGAAAEPPPA